jgi:hypothetical protein
MDSWCRSRRSGSGGTGRDATAGSRVQRLDAPAPGARAAHHRRVRACDRDLSRRRRPRARALHRLRRAGVRGHMHARAGPGLYQVDCPRGAPMVAVSRRRGARPGRARHSGPHGPRVASVSTRPVSRARRRRARDCGLRLHDTPWEPRPGDPAAARAPRTSRRGCRRASACRCRLGAGDDPRLRQGATDGPTAAHRRHHVDHRDLHRTRRQPTCVSPSRRSLHCAWVAAGEAPRRLPIACSPTASCRVRGPWRAPRRPSSTSSRTRGPRQTRARSSPTSSPATCASPSGRGRDRGAIALSGRALGTRRYRSVPAVTPKWGGSLSPPQSALVGGREGYRIDHGHHSAVRRGES